MKKILVVDTAASKTGALSVLQDFAAYIRENEHENEWHFLTGAEGLVEECENLHVMVQKDVKESRIKRLHFEHFSGAGFLSDLEADVVFSLQNTMPRGKIRNRNGYARKVLYVHQPLGFQNLRRFSFMKNEERHYAVYQHLISREINASVKRSDEIIVQTEWMRKAVIEKTGVDPEKVIKILPDVPDSGVRFEGVDSSKVSFVFPSGAILYKNHQIILDAVDILKISGITGFEVKFTVKREELPWLKGDIHDNIKFIGNIPRDELMEWYRDSVLIFPSYIETFGVPLAEARKSGTVAIAADTPFAREVLANYENAYFFNPFDAQGLAALMRNVINGTIKANPVRNEEDDDTENAYGKIIRELLK